MDRDEFINNCRKSGYCNKKQAEQYCENHTELSERDYEEVWRKYNGKYWGNAFMDIIIDNSGEKTRTTKRWKVDRTKP